MLWYKTEWVFLVKMLLVVLVVQAIALCNFTSKHAGSKAAGCSTGDMVCTKGGLVKHGYQLLLVNMLLVKPDGGFWITVVLTWLSDKLHCDTTSAVGRTVVFLACLDSGC